MMYDRLLFSLKSFTVIPASVAGCLAGHFLCCSLLKAEVGRGARGRGGPLELRLAACQVEVFASDFQLYRLPHQCRHSDHDVSIITVRLSYEGLHVQFL